MQGSLFAGQLTIDGATSVARVGTLNLAAKWHAGSPSPQPKSRIRRGAGTCFSASASIAAHIGAPFSKKAEKTRSSSAPSKRAVQKATDARGVRRARVSRRASIASFALSLTFPLALLHSLHFLPFDEFHRF